LSTNINRDYDLIFIDPPYKTNMLEDTLIKLQSLEYLSNAEYLYFEQQKDVNNNRCVNLINNDFEVVKNLSIGDVSYTIAKKR
jgi:N6-adenine-specific methylase